MAMLVLVPNRRGRLADGQVMLPLVRVVTNERWISVYQRNASGAIERTHKISLTAPNAAETVAAIRAEIERPIREMVAAHNARIASAPVEGEASVPVEGEASVPVEGEASVPVEGETLTESQTEKASPPPSRVFRRPARNRKPAKAKGE